MLITVYLYLLYLNIWFPEYKILGSYLISLSSLNILLHFILADSTMVEKSDCNLIG